jgi:Stage II sporulation protein E (SpoIIE)/SnoaL-like domain
MTLNKNKLINETYHKFIQTSLSDLPLVGIHDFIDENIMGYGTAIDEKILSISDYRELIIRQREQGKDIGIQFDLTPVLRKILADGNSAIFVDEIVVTMVINDETSQLFVRVSTVLEYREDKWIVVHWHGSRPGDVEGETDTWHINEWKQKNEKLERLVDEKTKDLLQKNKELEIEAALEKVRAVAMSMNRSEDLLSICEITFKEFQKLGFDNLRNAIIHILDDEKGFFMDYDYSDYLGGSINSINYNSHPIVDNYLKQIKKADDAFVEVVIEGDELDGWKEFRRKGGQLDDLRLDKISALHYYLYSIGVGDIGISTFSSIDESQIKILKRFRNVFDLTYRRYTDITKAEAQAREARIEAALEKVRSRTMGMQRSEELQEAAVELFQQIDALGVPVFGCGFNIWDNDRKAATAWMAGKDRLQPPFKTSSSEDIFLRTRNAAERGESFFVEELGGEELKNHYSYMNSIPVFKEIADQMAKSGQSFPTFQVMHCAFFLQGYLMFISFEPISYAHDIFRRFANVFQQTYTRFLDLRNAEEQNKIIQAENDRKTEELEEARQLQLAMLPKELPNLPNLDIAVYMQTATEVGGDYYDFHLQEDGTLTTVIGDATGHGMKAGTMVTITKSLFNSLASHKNILETFFKISDVVRRMKFRQLSMCLMMLKIKGNKLQVSSAAMPPALIYRKKEKTIEEIFIKGMPLGAMNDFPYSVKERHLQQGDTILLLSDGLPELSNSSNEMYGYNRIVKEFQSVGEREPEEIVNHFKNSALQWVNGKDPDDDVTFVVIKAK